MEPLSLVSAASVTFSVIDSLSGFNRASPGWITVKNVLTEMEILNAIMLESSATISGLGGIAPRSAEIALQQCEDSGRHLHRILQRFDRISPGKKKTFSLVLSWELRKTQIKILLESFRTSCHLLRQIAADAMTHTLLQQQIFHFEDVLDTKLGSDGKNANPKSTQLKGAEISISAAPETPDDPSTKDVHLIKSTQPPTQKGEAGSRRIFDSFDPFLQEGTLCRPSKTPEATWHPTKINLDTGSHFNVVTRRVLQEMTYEGPYLEPLPVHAETVKGPFRIQDRVQLQWSLRRSRSVYSSTFYIVDASFSLLIGGPEIQKHLVRDQNDSLFFFRLFGVSDEERRRQAHINQRLNEAAIDAINNNNNNNDNGNDNNNTNQPAAPAPTTPNIDNTPTPAAPSPPAHPASTTNTTNTTATATNTAASSAAARTPSVASG